MMLEAAGRAAAGAAAAATEAARKKGAGWLGGGDDGGSEAGASGGGDGRSMQQPLHEQPTAASWSHVAKALTSRQVACAHGLRQGSLPCGAAGGSEGGSAGGREQLPEAQESES